MNAKIAILLSTYNGEKYLKMQIQSLLEQDFKEWYLYIRDDGSTDRTVDIIEEFCKIHTNIYFISDGKNKGAAISFMYLLSIVEADYYMFCDQDDFWFKNKISTLYKTMDKNAITPELIFSDAKVTNEYLDIIDDSFWNYNKVSPNLLLEKPEYIAVYNSTPGCTMMFNRALKEHLQDYGEKVYMHDWYVMIKAAQVGVLKCVCQPLMAYRQHQNNVLGARKVEWRERFAKLLKVKKTIKEQIQIFQFCNKYCNINLLNFYVLKFKFNILRFKK
ncbi:glycosyltransferase [Flavobacteriaceae bacterium W22]|nr:glycosyltransferase [Flavobacteriaceae bacterium W22]